MVFFVASGCVVYTPLDHQAPPPAEAQVRVNLTTPGAVRMTDLLGRPLRALEGNLLTWGPDSLRVGLISATEYGRPWDAVDTLTLSRLEVSSLEEKTVDPVRTGVLVVGGSVVLGVTVAALFRAAARNDDGGKEGPPDQIVIPLLSFWH